MADRKLRAECESAQSFSYGADQIHSAIREVNEKTAGFCANCRATWLTRSVAGSRTMGSSPCACAARPSPSWPMSWPMRRPCSSPRHDGASRGFPPLGGTAAADLRRRPARGPTVPRHHAPRRLHHAAVRDRPDPDLTCVPAPPPRQRVEGYERVRHVLPRQRFHADLGKLRPRDRHRGGLGQWHQDAGDSLRSRRGEVRFGMQGNGCFNDFLVVAGMAP